jgi:hypothetical protein
MPDTVDILYRNTDLAEYIRRKIGIIAYQGADYLAFSPGQGGAKKRAYRVTLRGRDTYFTP